MYRKKKFSINEISNFTKHDWYCISIIYELSESFIETFSDKVDWDCVIKYQNLSREFLIKHLDKVTMSWLIQNKKINKSVKEEIKLLKRMIQ